MLPCKLQTWLVGIALHGARSLAPCHGLSGGERLKLGVLMVLAQLPDLLLLDEPDNHLDHASRPATHPGAGRLSVSALESASVFPKISSSHLKSITSSLDFHYDHSRTC